MEIPDELARRFTALATARGATDPKLALIGLVRQHVEQEELARGAPLVLPWTKFARVLHSRFAETFGSTDVVQTPTSRKKAAVFLAQRTSRRVVALGRLFEMGLYLESLSLVRSAYEDWLICAHLFLLAGERRADDFWNEDQLKLVYKTFRGVSVLAGDAVARSLVASETLEASKKYDGANSRQLSPLSGKKWSEIAEEAGLKAVHDWVYTHLSGLVHGSVLSASMINGPGEFDAKNARAKLFVRDPFLEQIPATWAFWFSLRTLTMSAREFGFSLESESDAVIAAAPTPRDILNCVLVRERAPHP